MASLAMLASAPTLAHAAPWRSALYPQNWTPGHLDAQGRGLHDFSYAGYHAGERPLPTVVPGPFVDVSKPPYSADTSGTTDATAAIQAAIDAVSASGGGVVYLPAGTFRVRPLPGRIYALHIGQSGVVLRGAGPTKTFLFGDETVMRHKRIILVRPNAAADTSWSWDNTDGRAIAQDVTQPTKTIAVSSTDALQPGDSIVLRADPTAALIAELGMTGKWTPDNFGGPIFLRRVVAVDVAKKTITIDSPTRFRLLVRDAARVAKVVRPLVEIGIEELAIGNRENLTSGTDDDDYGRPGTAGYQMHEAFAVWMTHVENGWVRNVRSYRPTGNVRDVHVLSGGIRLDSSRFVTITGTRLEKPQYRGEGGNGYLYVLAGNDCLLSDSEGINGRHSFSFAFMQSSGNVVLRFHSVDARLPADFHQKLSPANLIDGAIVEGDALEAVERSCCDHGHSTTESVFWNTRGERYRAGQFVFPYIVESAQLGNGYVIGTRGPANAVRTGGGSSVAPADWVEGVGEGDELVPRSLYDDQRARRLGLSQGVGGLADAGNAGDPMDGSQSGSGPHGGAGGPDGDGARGSGDPAPTAGADAGCDASGASRDGSGMIYVLSAIAAAAWTRAQARQKRRADKRDHRVRPP